MVSYACGFFYPYSVNSNSRFSNCVGTVCIVQDLRMLTAITCYNQFQAWDKTVEIGFKLGEGEMLDASAARAMVIASYRAGQPKVAAGYLETYFGAKTGDARQPASLDGFDEIANELRSDSALMRHKPARNPDSVRLPTKLPPKRKHK